MQPHSKTYLEFKPENIIHKTRLRNLISMFQQLSFSANGSWADFGCSDGFILSIVRSEIVPEEWKLYGFDFSSELIDLARKRNIAGTSFGEFNLNLPAERRNTLCDVVTCFETLEHVGNYRNAIDNLISHLKPAGTLIISVPNETGIAGIIKLLGRMMLRKNAYGDFFRHRKFLSYLLSLIAGNDIEKFRDPSSAEWSQHLGFNYKNVFRYIDEKYVQQGKLKRVKTDQTFFGFNKIIILKNTRRV